MPRPKSKDLARAADHAAIREATEFRVNWLIGRGEYRHAYFTSVQAAREARIEAGCDEHGRTGVIYAICANGLTVHVDESYEP